MLSQHWRARHRSGILPTVEIVAGCGPRAKRACVSLWRESEAGRTVQAA